MDLSHKKCQTASPSIIMLHIGATTSKYIRHVSTMAFILVYCSEMAMTTAMTTMVDVFGVEIDMFTMRNCLSDHANLWSSAQD